MMLFLLYLIGVCLGLLVGLLLGLREINASIALIDAKLAEWAVEDA